MTAIPKRAAPDEAQRLAFGLLVAAGIGIGFSGIFVRLAEVGPTASAFWRMIIALPPLALWMMRERARGPAPRLTFHDRFILALAGALYAAELVLWHWSLGWTSVANATVIANIYPVFVTLGAWLVFRQRTTARFILGLAIAIAGMIVLVGDKLRLGGGGLEGEALCVATSVFYGGYFLVVVRLRRAHSVATVMAWGAAVAALILFPLALAAGERVIPPSGSGWLALILLGLVCQAGAQGAIAYALAHLPASLSAVTLLIQPLTAAVMAWLILAEPIGAFQFAGGAILLAGIFIARRGTRTS
jgi:drug/metabolite transporter (DMT)-like permease